MHTNTYTNRKDAKSEVRKDSNGSPQRRRERRDPIRMVLCALCASAVQSFIETWWVLGVLGVLGGSISVSANFASLRFVSDPLRNLLRIAALVVRVAR